MLKGLEFTKRSDRIAALVRLESSAESGDHSAELRLQEEQVALRIHSLELLFLLGQAKRKEEQSFLNIFPANGGMFH